MRTLIMFLALLCIINQNGTAQPEPRPHINHEGKFAYIVSDYVYDNALPFYDDEAAVKQNGKWFYIDEYFEPISPRVDTIDFSFGRHSSLDYYYTSVKLMKSGGKWFVYDTWKNWQSDSFDVLVHNITSYNNIVVRGFDQKQYLINIKNHKISTTFDSLIWPPGYCWQRNAWVQKDNRVVRINSKLEKVQEVFEYVEPLGNNMYRYAFKQNNGWNIRVGRKNKFRKELSETDIFIFPEYELYMIKKKGKAYVNSGYGDERFKKINIEATGPLYEGDDPVGLWNILINSDSSRILFKREKYGFMDRYLHITIPTQYDFAYEFWGKNHTAIKTGEKWYLIDRQGKIISKDSYEYLSPRASLYIAQKDGFYGVIDSEEQLIAPFEYSRITESEYSLIAKRNGLFGLIGKNGEILTSFEFDSLRYIDKSWFAYEKDGLRGIYDANTGKKILEGHFMTLTRIGNGYIYHIDGTKKELIASTGEVLVSGTFGDITDLGQGFFGLRKGNEAYYLGSTYTIYDANENKMVPGEYADIGIYNENMFPVSNGRKYGFIDKQGQMLIPFKYDYALGFKNGRAKVLKWPIYFYIDHMGKISKNSN